MADFLCDPEIMQGAEQRTEVPLSHSLQSFKVLFFFFFPVEHGEEKTPPFQKHYKMACVNKL